LHGRAICIMYLQSTLLISFKRMFEWRLQKLIPKVSYTV
jgi:hypothetical protein